MALITCPECNKQISDQAKSCPHCGYRLPKAKKMLSPHKKNTLIAVIVGVLLVFASFAGYFFFSPYTVKWCCYHHISDATCTEPKTCSRCGQTWGISIGHNWQTATCTEPKTCTVSGTTEGSANGHDWSPATCTLAQRCKVCGHRGEPSLGHDVKDYICTRCGISVVSESDVPNILDIISATYTMNYLGGIDQYMTFVNKSSTKTINYITVEIDFKNAVGDVLRDDISGKQTTSLEFTGPLSPGKTSSETYWRTCFYNSTFSGTIGIREIEIKYSDGTTLVLDEDVAYYAVKSWR